MASTATVAASIIVNDGTKNTVQESYSVAGISIVADNGKREKVTLAAGPTTITPPTTAKGALIMVQGQVNLTLKGVAGDTGVALQGAAANQIPLLLPLAGAGATFVFNSTAGGSVEIIWI
jgi:hypothetical protein